MTQEGISMTALDDVEETAPEAVLEPAEAEEPPKKIPYTVLYEINGFDQLAIAKFFKLKVADFQADLVMGARVAVFLDKREQGVRDEQAYMESMKLRLPELTELMDTSSIEVEEVDDPLESPPTT